MVKILNQVEPDRFVLHLEPVIKLTDDQLFELCQINQELWIERTAEGDLVIMAPEGWETGIRGANLVTLLTQWAWQDGTGVTTGSSLICGFYFAEWRHARSRCRMGVALTLDGFDCGAKAKISAALP